MDIENKNIFISYIVPCYNLQNCISRCLESLMSQKNFEHWDIEFIIVNDGSTDSTLSLLREFEKRETRAVVVDQANQGVSVARNNGLKIAKGKYVFFLDGDDFLTPEASQLLYDMCVDSNPDIIISNAFYLMENRVDKKTEWNVCQEIKPGLYSVSRFVDLVHTLPISFKAYKRDFLIQNSIYYDVDLKVGEVYTFFFHCLAYAKTIAFTENHIMNYLVRGGSVMREYSVKRDSLIINTIKRINDYASLYEYDIKSKLSYNKSLYDIVNMFGLKKYYSGPLWNKDVVNFLESVRKNEIYKNVIKILINENRGSKRKAISLALYSYLPVWVSYRLYRIRIRTIYLFNLIKLWN